MSNRAGIMLCYPYEESRLLRWGCRHYIYQHKFDGDRGRIILDPKNILLLSSEEKLRNFALPHIVEQAAKIAPALNAHGIYELDGEFYNHDLPHEEIHSRVSRTVNLHDDYSSIEFHIFDHIVEEVSQFSRLADLFGTREILNSCESLKLAFAHVVHYPSELLQLLRKSISLGYEGMIVRNPNALYLRRRSVDIMKFKPHREDIYTIIGYKEEISIHGEPKGRLGALVCTDGDIEFSVSAGLTVDQKVALWKIREELASKKVRVKYQAKTKYGTPKFFIDLEIL